MQLRQELHIFVGMQQDTSPSKQDAKFLCDAHNIRITAVEGKTAFSLTNERGPKKIKFQFGQYLKNEDLTIDFYVTSDDSIQGSFIGGCVLNDYYILFTHLNEEKDTFNNILKSAVDRIYRFELIPVESIYRATLLYQGNLGFDLSHPLETLVSYENDSVLKVYWIDGINQPRYINVSPYRDIRISNYNLTSFDFVPTVALNEDITVERYTGTDGIFAPGTILYAFSYYNKYGLETNIFYTTPIYYTSFWDRGASPEDSVKNSFKITAKNLDTNFDYLRIYSIQRTSYNGTPVCKRVQDLEISTYQDRIVTTHIIPSLDFELTIETKFLVALDNLSSLNALFYTVDDSTYTLSLSLLTLNNIWYNGIHTDIIGKAYKLGKYAIEQVTQPSSSAESFVGNVYTVLNDGTGYILNSNYLLFPYSTPDKINLDWLLNNIRNSVSLGLYYSSVRQLTILPNVTTEIESTDLNTLRIYLSSGYLNEVLLSYCSGLTKDETSALGISYGSACSLDYDSIYTSSTKTITSLKYRGNRKVMPFDYLLYIKKQILKGYIISVRARLKNYSSLTKPVYLTVYAWRGILLDGCEDNYLEALSSKALTGEYQYFDIIPSNINDYDYFYLGADIDNAINAQLDIVEIKISQTVRISSPRLLMEVPLNNLSLDTQHTYDNKATYAYRVFYDDVNDIYYLSTYENYLTSYYIDKKLTADNNIDTLDKQYIIGTGTTENTYDVVKYSDVTINIATEGAKKTTVDSISFIDNGTMGDSEDPTKLLYVGGENITALTMCQKDGTLFFGNIEIKRPTFTKSYASYLLSSLLNSIFTSARSIDTTVVSTENYPYYNQLKSYSAGFKQREYYRLGILFQYKTGKWSDPIFIGDYQVGNSYIASELSKYKGKIPMLNYDSDSDTSSVTVPIFKADSIDANIFKEAYSLGYRRIRTVAVFPGITDRTIMCQGVINPTMYTNLRRTIDNDLYALASWFFRPYYNSIYSPVTRSCTINLPRCKGALDLAIEGLSYVRQVEIEGYYLEDNTFLIDWGMATLNSPELEFDDYFSNLDLNGVGLNYIGYTDSLNTLSSIDAEMASTAISAVAAGFQSKQYISVLGGKNHLGGVVDINKSAGLISLFLYRDGIVEDENDAEDSKTYISYKAVFANSALSNMRWLVYPWQNTGSLNNDVLRGANAGTRTAQLLKKKLSNLRCFDTVWDTVDNIPLVSKEFPLLYSSDLATIVKIGNKIYQGNVDIALLSDNPYPKFFSFSGRFTSNKLSLTGLGSYEYFYLDLLYSLYGKNTTAFPMYNKTPDFCDCIFSLGKHPSKEYDAGWWTFNFGLTRGYDISGEGTFFPEYMKSTKVVYNSIGAITGLRDGSSVFNSNMGEKADDIGNLVPELANCKSNVRLTYKSSPHIVLSIDTSKYSYIDVNDDYTSFMDMIGPTDKVFLPIVEMTKDYIPLTFLGGTTDDAKKLNQWLPVGDPILMTLEDSGDITLSKDIEWKYGDTWYQRYDCLKTYAFTKEDKNQVIEIGSFVLETHVNPDSRYDRNRGEINNREMSPTNFNVYNKVYSQLDNFFTYRILSDSVYENNKFSSQLTWGLEKSLGADVDNWTEITLSSTYDLDGSKGTINKLITWNDNILCFLTLGICKVIFNPRVLIPTSDNNPIEISNSYKMEGKQYVADGMGCLNKFAVTATPSGIYFIDTISKDICMISDKQANLSKTNNLSVYSQGIPANLWTPVDYTCRMFHDNVNNDLYITTALDCLDYNELLGQFISFMSYEGLMDMFNVRSGFFCIKEDDVPSFYQMWKGQPNVFFDKALPFDFTFISNGMEDQQTRVLNKTFTNINFRADRWTDEIDGTLRLNDNGYRLAPFDYIRVWNEYLDSELKSLTFVRDHSSNEKAKFRTWRVEIPRSKSYTTELLRNGIAKTITHRRDRILNQWCRITLGITLPELQTDDTINTDLVEMHDLETVYYI